MEPTVAPVQAPPKMEPAFTPTQATRGSRLLAFIVDLAVSLLVWLVAFFISEPAIFLIGVIGLVVYQVYLLSTQGQTIGKKVMGIKIVKDDNGQNGGFVTNVLLRTILNGIICAIPFYFLVDVLFIFREDQRCIHDLIAGTKVVEA
jgi:uncharacterized RDD family membrane protein YckC